jgi:hypothetical protein
VVDCDAKQCGDVINADICYVANANACDAANAEVLLSTTTMAPCQ